MDSDDAPRWIRDRDGRAGKFLSGLDTIEFGWEELSEAIGAASDADEILMDTDDSYSEDDKQGAQTWFSWLDRKSDEALLRLYHPLGVGSRQQVLDCDLADVPIIRLRKRDKVTHVRGSRLTFPQDLATPSNPRSDRSRLL